MRSFHNMRREIGAIEERTGDAGGEDHGLVRATGYVDHGGREQGRDTRGSEPRQFVSRRQLSEPVPPWKIGQKGS